MTTGSSRVAPFPMLPAFRDVGVPLCRLDGAFQLSNTCSDGTEAQSATGRRPMVAYHSAAPRIAGVVEVGGDRGHDLAGALAGAEAP